MLVENDTVSTAARPKWITFIFLALTTILMVGALSTTDADQLELPAVELTR